MYAYHHNSFNQNLPAEVKTSRKYSLGVGGVVAMEGAITAKRIALGTHQATHSFLFIYYSKIYASVTL